MSDVNQSQSSIEQTQVLAELFEEDRSNRSSDWVERFLASVPTAALATTDKDRVFTGPDGFLYFGLFLPEEGKEFNATCLLDSLDFCSQEGLGIAVFGKDLEEPEWVFNYGSVWNYKVYQNFYDNPFAEVLNEGSEEEAEVEEKRSETVLVSSPSEDYLPLFVRAVILRDLDQQNVSEPSLFMMTVPNESSYLVFNVFPEDYEEEHYEFLQQYLVWVLPQGFSIANVPLDSEVCEHFVSLREMIESPIN